MERRIARGSLKVPILVDGEPIEVGPGFKDRREAAAALLDRGWGKPTQPLSGDGEGGAIQVVIQKIGSGE